VHDTPRDLRRRPRTEAVRPELAVLVGVGLVLGVALRFVASTPLWLDEALTANLAELSPSELLEALRSDGHPPLYYLLLHYWGGLVGSSDAALRALSGVLSVAALPLAWIAGRRFGGPVAGWVAVAVLAMNPFALRYATENRMYSLVALEVLVVWLLADDLWAGRSARWRVPALAVAAGALLWTQYWGAFLLGAVGLVAVWRWLRGSAPERRGSMWVVVGLLGAGILFVPWLPSLLDQLGSTGTPWAAGMRPTAAAGQFLGDLAGGVPRETYLFAALFGAVAVLGLFGRISTDPHLVELDVRTTPTVRTEAVLIVLALGVGATVGWLGDTAFASRYAMVVLPLVVLVLTAGIVVVTHRSARAVLLALVLAAGVVASGHELTSNRTQSGEWATAIVADARPGDVVALCPDQLGPATERSLRQRLGEDLGGLEVVGVPALDDARFVDWVDYEERNAAADPNMVAAALTDLAGPDGAVFVVWNPSYRTYEGLCEGLVEALGATYPAVTELVVAEPEDNFEHATVTWFRR
jgi:mannosyltransferase